MEQASLLGLLLLDSCLTPYSSKAPQPLLQHSLINGNSGHNVFGPWPSLAKFFFCFTHYYVVYPVAKFQGSYRRDISCTISIFLFNFIQGQLLFRLVRFSCSLSFSFPCLVLGITQCCHPVGITCFFFFWAKNLVLANRNPLTVKWISQFMSFEFNFVTFFPLTSGHFGLLSLSLSASLPPLLLSLSSCLWLSSV